MKSTAELILIDWSGGGGGCGVVGYIFFLDDLLVPSGCARACCVRTVEILFKCERRSM